MDQYLKSNIIISPYLNKKIVRTIMPQNKQNYQFFYHNLWIISLVDNHCKISRISLLHPSMRWLSQKTLFKKWYDRTKKKRGDLHQIHIDIRCGSTEIMFVPLFSPIHNSHFTLKKGTILSKWIFVRI